MKILLRAFFWVVALMSVTAYADPELKIYRISDPDGDIHFLAGPVTASKDEILEKGKEIFSRKKLVIKMLPTSWFPAFNEKTIAMEVRQCEIGVPASCRELAIKYFGYFYIFNDSETRLPKNLIQPDIPAALDFLSKAIALNDFVAIKSLARLEGEENLKILEVYLKNKCVKDAASFECLTLAVLNLKNDRAEFWALVSEGCKRGNNLACDFQALQLIDQDRSNIPTAAKILKSSCDKNSAFGCAFLALNQTIFLDLVSDDEATQYAKKACGLGLMEACDH